MNILTNLLPFARKSTTMPPRSPQRPPVATRIYVNGAGMVRVLDATTGKVLGFRQTYREACWLAAELERGEHLQRAS
jgi:hypothetical protein